MGGCNAKHSAYSFKYPPKLILIIKLFFIIGEVEAVLPEKIERPAPGPAH